MPVERLGLDPGPTIARQALKARGARFTILHRSAASTQAPVEYALRSDQGSASWLGPEGFLNTTNVEQFRRGDTL